MYVLTVVSVTEQKRPKSLWWMKKKCFPFIIVFYIEHISVQLVLINVFIWWFVFVIWKQNTILRRHNIVLNVKFHFAGGLRGFAHYVCDFWFVCRVLRAWGMLSENVCKQSRKTVTFSLSAPGHSLCVFQWCPAYLRLKYVITGALASALR